MRLSEAIDALLLATETNGRSFGTVKNYREKLGYLLKALGDVDIEAVTVQDLRRYVSTQFARVRAGELAEATVAGRVRMVKRLFNFLVEEGIIDDNPARRLSGLSEAELVALVESGDLEAQETEAGLLIEKASLSEFVSILVDLRLIADAEANAEAE